MLKIFKNLDDAFLNSAYLSELWAVKDLIRIKNLCPEFWTQAHEKQLADEVRHANMLLRELKSNSVIIEDLSYSMQERLYRKYINLNQSKTPGESGVVHNMTESRAVWIYKTYLRFGKNKNYKKCILQIIEDEEQHFETNNKNLNEANNFLADTISGIDKAIFNEILPHKFGRIIFQSNEFWNAYYEGAEKSRDFIIEERFKNES